MSYEHEKSTSRLWEWVKAICTIVLVSVFSYKIVFSDFALDTATLLSLLLAFFSIGLSALFYFKATETSNAFYDNTFKYTKDIANLLTKIDSGFGERLDSLKDNYTTMYSSMQNNFGLSNSDIENEKNELESEKVEIKKAIEERDQIIQNLIKNAGLDENDKNKISKQLEDKDKLIRTLQTQIESLNDKILENKELHYQPDISPESLLALNRYLDEIVIHNMGINWVIENKDNFNLIKARYKKIGLQIKPEFHDKLSRWGILSAVRYNQLTSKGIKYLIERATLAREKNNVALVN